MNNGSAASSGSPRNEGDLARDLAEVLASELPLEQLLERLCASLAARLEAHQVVVALRDENTTRTAFMYERDKRDEAVQTEIPVDANLQAVIESGRSYVGPLVMNGRRSAAMLVPLRVGIERFGALGVMRPAPLPYLEDDEQFLQTSALYVAIGIRNAQLMRVKGQLQELATTDNLTGINNRRVFDQALSREWQRCARAGEELSVVLIDVDYFKNFNDRYGHLAGDACLQQIAQVIARSISRPGDVFARYGGEEFGAVLPSTGSEGAIAVAEQLRAAVANLAIIHDGSQLNVVTVSVGVATTMPKHDIPPPSLVREADAALYRAKEAGRNRVVNETYESTAPHALRRTTGSRNLPVPLTSFLGRESELAEAQRLLGQSRLLTFVGPGGVGKTRLALQLASGLSIDGGIWFIDLAPIGGASLVTPALLNALGLREEHGRPLLDTIADHIRTTPTLIVLDNCEQFVAACAQMTETLLHRCAGLKVISTSREPLGIIGEMTYRLPSLAVPPPDVSTAADALRYDAVRLFSERASAANAAFKVSDDNAAVVSLICTRLDGLPLAIELAAPRLKVMTLSQIEEGLNDRFRLLSSGSRTAQPRQQTLHALIAWSFDLLSSKERILMRRLSVLVNDWPMEAAAGLGSGAVVRKSPGVTVGIERGEINSLIGSLVDKSLVIAEPRGEQIRYRLLESTREFAWAELMTTGDESSVRGRHANYYAEYLESLGDGPESIDRIKRDYENIRLALGWALGPAGDRGIGLRLVSQLVPFWSETGDYRESRGWVERILAVEPQAHEGEVYKQLSLELASMAWMLGDFEFAVPLARQVLAICERDDDFIGMSRARRIIAFSIVATGGDINEAKSLMQKILDDPRTAENDADRMRVLHTLAVLAAEGERDLAAAERHVRAALAIAQRLDRPKSIATSLNNLGMLAHLQGRHDEALVMMGESRALYEKLGHEHEGAALKIAIAGPLAAKGQLDETRRHLREALDFYRKHPDEAEAIELIEEYAKLSVATKNYRRAARLFGFADRARKVRRLPRLPTMAHTLDPLIAEVRAKLDAEGFSDAWARGASFRFDQAADEGLEA